MRIARLVAELRPVIRATCAGFVTFVLVTNPARAQEPRDDDLDATGALVTDVTLRGVHEADAEELEASLATQASECRGLIYQPFCWFSNSETFVVRRYLDRMEVRRDEARIALFYWLRGFRHASATANIERTDDGVRVVFDVVEGPPTTVRDILVTQADSVLPRAAIDAAMQITTGSPFDIVALDSSITRLYDALWERGYADATIEVDTGTVADTGAARVATIDVRVAPNARTTVGAIAVTGNDDVAARSIRRLLTFEPGDIYRRGDVVRSQRNLILSGLFKSAEITAHPSGDSAKVITVRAAEADLRNLDLSAGFNSIDYAQLDARFTRLNFLGGARELSVAATVGNLLSRSLSRIGLFESGNDLDDGRFRQLTWQGSIDFTQPWFLGEPNELGLSVFGHRSIVPNIVIDRGYGARSSLTRTIAPRATATLGYAYESSAVDAGDVYFCVTFGVCIQSTIRALARQHTLSPTSLVGQIDRTNDALQPTRGYRARLGLEHASALTISDFRYTRAAFDASVYRPIGRGAVLAGRLRLGWVDALASTNSALGVGGLDPDGVVHPRKRFFAGGARSVRGFGENQLGPRILTVSPAALTDTTLVDPCTEAELTTGTCNPNIRGLDASAFQPQPLGGTALADVSVEYRFRITEPLDGAVFVDAALIGTDTFSDLLGATGAITPGAGVRLDTPIGPVRLDLGLRPRLVEDLPVITQVTAEDGTTRLVRLETFRRYDPTERSGGSGNLWRQIVERLTLHLAVGPAF